MIITESHGGRVIPHAIKPIADDHKRYEISFTPMVARQHTVLISADNQTSSTRYVDVFNLNKIRVSGIKDGVLGAASIFTVDTHGAGEGHLEVTISDGQKTLPAELKKNQARKFDIGFQPESTGTHSIAIAFNGKPVEGSPFKVNIQNPPLSDKESADDEDEDEDDDDGEGQTEDHQFIIGGQLEGTKVGELAWLICPTPLSGIYEDFDFFVTGTSNENETSGFHTDDSVL